MPTDRTRVLRRFWFQAHKWLGIALAIMFIPLSLTGSLLVWDEPLDRLLRPSHHRAGGAPALPATAYADAARAVLPGNLAILSMNLQGDGPVQVVAGERKPAPGRRGPPPRTGVWLDPATARVIDVGPTASPLVRWMHVFHGSLMVPGVGRTIVGWLGVAMFVSAVSGLWLWWPLSGRPIRGLRWKRRRETDANLHYLAGFWMAIPLGLLALTGALISFPVLTGAGGRAGMRQPPAPPLATTRLDPAAAIAAAVPLAHGRPVSLTWPTEREPAWKVGFGRGRPPVSVDDASGRAGEAAGGGDARRSMPLYRKLHQGDGTGFVYQLIIFVAGIAPALLGVTGIIMWLRGRRWKGDLRRRRSQPMAVPAE